MRILRRIGEESGFALVLALATMVVLAISVTAIVDYTTSNQRSAARGGNQTQAAQYAEAGLNAAYSVLNYQNAQVGGANGPSAANRFGCNGASGPSDTTGPSNCAVSVRVPLCFGVASTCTSSTATQQPGTASVYGYFSGTNPGSYDGVTVPASTWLLYSTGYARNPIDNSIVAKTATATVTISAANAGAVASVWNHVFVTAPKVANTCQMDFGGNNIVITNPLYVVGNLCLGNATISEDSTTGQKVDLMVGGKLVFGGGRVGASSTQPITSGIVVDGCTSSITTAGATCSPSSFNYWVSSADTYIVNEQPEQSATDIQNDYNNFDPGPKHACASSSSPASLPASTFDNDTTSNNSAATFNLTPSTSYTCVSQVGSSVGRLSWDASTKVLTIAGSIFIDGSAQISQSAVYSGTAALELAGTFTFNGNGTTLCAVSGCSFTNWQGSSGNNSMLTIVALASNTTSVTFTDNSQTYQGSLWTQPSSKMTFVKNGVTVQGPMSIGSFDASFNNASFKPLPVIKNMPLGAPVPPNVGASIGPLTFRD